MGYRSGASHWVGTWSASPQDASSPLELDGQTVRQVVRVSLGGARVRVRLSNVYGAGSLRIGAARVGLRSADASTIANSSRVLTFNGLETATIPAGALAVSDPVEFKVPNGAELAVSIYVPGREITSTEHSLALQTTYISPPGDFSGADTLPTLVTTRSIYFLTGIEVEAPKTSSAVVALGDSITDGLHSTVGANRRWPDRLGARLCPPKRRCHFAVLNAGISGNRLLHDTIGTNVSARLDRDVLVQSGARYLIVLAGINDIGFPGSATADEIIAGHRQIIDRAHAVGLKVYGGTLTPFRSFLPGIYYTADGETKRQTVNRWIRTSKAYDAVIDFDRAIRNPDDPASIRAEYDSGDNLHPNDAGYQAMADAIDLSLFSNATPGWRATKAKAAPIPAVKSDANRCPCPSLNPSPVLNRRTVP